MNAETIVTGIIVALLTFAASTFATRVSGRNERQRIGQEFAQIMGTERQRIATELEAARTREREQATKDAERAAHVDTLWTRIQTLSEEISQTRITARETEAALRGELRAAVARSAQLEAALIAAGVPVPAV